MVEIPDTGTEISQNPAPGTAPVRPGYLGALRQRLTSDRAGVAMRGGAWSITGYVATQVLRMAATLVLARSFLGPELFGVVGLVGIFLAGISMFSELGIVSNIVQHARGEDPRFLNTAFTIQAGRGMLIWILAGVAAYPLARFYRLPEVLPLLIVAAVSEVIRGLTSTAVWTLTRQVKLKEITLLTLASEVVAFGVSIVWAMLSPSAWALVARTIVSVLVYAVGSHLVAKPRIRFGWDRAAAKDILHFGGWISIATATYFLGSQGERLILGKYITPAELGCFSLALMIVAAPAGGINQLVSQIFLPMLSHTVRTSRPETIRDYLRSRRLFFGVALFAALGFLICGRPFVSHVLPPKYAMTGWMLQLLGLRVALDVFAAPATSLVMAYGQTKYSAGANTTRLVLMVLGIFFAFQRYGMLAAVIALIAAQAASYFPLIAGLSKLLPEVTRAELRWYTGFLVVITLAAFLFCRSI